LSIELSSRSTT